ncbi:MAG: helix-turn-helix domain-containing protein, partial [Myxococcota bacterium]
MPGPSQPSRIRLRTGIIDLRTGCLPDGRRLTSRELQLLAFLARQPGQPVSRQALLEHFGYHRATRSRAVDKSIYTLRAKVELDPGSPAHVLTVQGVGYVLQLDGEATRNPTPPRPALFGREDALAELGNRLREQPWIVLVG